MVTDVKPLSGKGGTRAVSSRKPEVQRWSSLGTDPPYSHRPSLQRGLPCSLASVPEVSPFGVCLPPGDGSGWLAQSDLDSLILVLGGDSVSRLPFAVPCTADMCVHYCVLLQMHLGRLL